MYSFWISLHLVDHSGWQFQFCRSWFCPLKRIGNWAVNSFLEHVDERKISIPLKTGYSLCMLEMQSLCFNSTWTTAIAQQWEEEVEGKPNIGWNGGNEGYRGMLKHLESSCMSLTHHPSPSSLTHDEWAHSPFKWWHLPISSRIMYVGKRPPSQQKPVVDICLFLLPHCRNIRLEILVTNLRKGSAMWRDFDNQMNLQLTLNPADLVTEEDSGGESFWSVQQYPFPGALPVTACQGACSSKGVGSMLHQQGTQYVRVVTAMPTVLVL